MLIKFKKIPAAAIYCYLCGFIILSACLVIYYYFPPLLSTLFLQQCFIGGAIIVAIGSVINSLYQFKSSSLKTDNNHHKGNFHE